MTVERFFLLKDLEFPDNFEVIIESLLQSNQHCGVVLCPQIIEVGLQSTDKFSKQASFLQSIFPKIIPTNLAKLICHVKKYFYTHSFCEV